MGKLKFSLAYVLMGAAALGFAFFCFLGKNYLVLGDDKITVVNIFIPALITFLLLSGFAAGAAFMRSTDKNFDTFSIFEKIFLGLFTVTVLAQVFVIKEFSHFFAVWETRTEINDALIPSITDANDMFTEYERAANNRIEQYKNTLESMEKTEGKGDSAAYVRQGFGSDRAKNAKLIEEAIEVLEVELFPGDDPTDYEAMKQSCSTWSVYAKGIVDRQQGIVNDLAWIMNIVNVVEKVGKNSENWRDTLILTYGSVSADTGAYNNASQAGTFDYTPKIANIKNLFIERGGPNLPAIAWAIGLYVLMLLPYIFSALSDKRLVDFGPPDDTVIEWPPK